MIALGKAHQHTNAPHALWLLAAFLKPFFCQPRKDKRKPRSIPCLRVAEYFRVGSKSSLSAVSTGLDTLDTRTADTFAISRTAGVQPKSEDQPLAKRIAAELARPISGFLR
jgi:hypothetical protein